VEDLVRVGVADPAEEPRVRERALERVALSAERGLERLEVGLEHLEPAGVVEGEGVPAANQVQRSAARRARFRHDEGAGRKVERDKPYPTREAGAGAAPVEPPGDHQMKDEEEAVVELDDDPLPEPPEAAHGPADGGLERRVDRP